MSDSAVPHSTLPPHGAPTTAASNRSALLIVFLVVVIDLLGFGIVLPLLPRYSETYVGQLVYGDARTAAEAAAVHHWREHIVGGVVGLLMASFSLMQFIFAPIWGRISDRIGRRPILLLGLTGSVVFYALFGVASDLPAERWAGVALALMFLARIGAGIAGATISTAQAVIADCTTPEKRKHGMALIGAAFGVGFTFGPIIAAGALFFFPDFQGLIGYVAAALSAVALGLAVAKLPETRRFGGPVLDRKWIDFPAAVAALRSPAVGPVILTFFLATLGFGGFEATLSLFNKDALRLNNWQNGLLFAYVGLVLIAAQGGLYRPLAKRLDETTLISIGMVLLGAGVGSLAGVAWLAWLQALAFAAALIWVMVSLTVAVVGFALLTPSAQALVSRRSDPEKQGEILGVNQSASAMARILGPILGLSFYFATPSHLLPFLLGGSLVLLMLFLVPRLRRGDAAAFVPPPGSTAAFEIIRGGAGAPPEDGIRKSEEEVQPSEGFGVVDREGP
jgi:MFS family permease